MGSYGHPGTRSTRDGGAREGSLEVLGQHGRHPPVVPLATLLQRSSGRSLHHETGGLGHSTARDVSDVGSPADAGEPEIVKGPLSHPAYRCDGHSAATSSRCHPEPHKWSLLGGALLQVERAEQLAAACVDAGKRGVVGRPEVAAGPDEPVGGLTWVRARHRRPALDLLVLAGTEDGVGVLGPEGPQQEISSTQFDRLHGDSLPQVCARSPIDYDGL